MARWGMEGFLRPCTVTHERYRVWIFEGLSSRRGTPRAAEKIEDEVPLPRAGDERPAHQTERLLGGVAAVELLPAGGRRAPDGKDLRGRISAVYCVAVEGVAGGPHGRLVRMDSRKLGQRRAWNLGR